MLFRHCFQQSLNYKNCIHPSYQKCNKIKFNSPLPHGADVMQDDLVGENNDMDCADSDL